MAVQLAESLRAAIANLDIENSESPNGGCLTISIGVATCYPAPDNNPEALVALADQSLYAAKQTGRNRVVGAHDSGGIRAVRNSPQSIQASPEPIAILRSRPRA
jgi:PleD family two-component response regulator